MLSIKIGLCLSSYSADWSNSISIAGILEANRVSDFLPVGSILCFGVASRFLYGLAWDAETSARERNSRASRKPTLMEEASVAIVSVSAFCRSG